MTPTMKIAPPGSTIGIVGGGQLGRMIGMAAVQLGYRVHIFAPDGAAFCSRLKFWLACTCP